MTMQATHPTDEQTEAEAALDALAAQAEGEEAAAEQAEQATEGEWEDVDAQLEQAKALAKMGVQGVQFLAGMIHPGHTLDANARDQGEASLLPVALDFAGEVPEWLRPYMHYLGAGLWIGGVMFGAVQARRAEDAEKARQEAEAEKKKKGAFEHSGATSPEGAAYGV